MANFLEEIKNRLQTDYIAASLKRDWINVSGTDSLSFLQGQLSADLDTVAVGKSTMSFVLFPNGKVCSLVSIWRKEEFEFVIDVELGFGEAVVERLNQFLFRVDVKIDLQETDVWSLHGRGAEQIDIDGLALHWKSKPGLRLLKEDLVVPNENQISNHEFDFFRICSGIPVDGKEINEKTIPQEVGWIEQSASFTKGCYTGQELVARLDTRGHINKRLCGFLFDQEGLLIADSSIASDHQEVGKVTSSVSVDGQTAALGFVRREINQGDTVQIGELMTQVQELPLIS